MLKKSLLSVATAAALSLSLPATAHRACVDDLCLWEARVSIAEPASTGGGAVIETPRYGTWGIDTAGMDTSVKPGEDFFAYVSGSWAKTTEIPADQSRYGAFMMLGELSERRVHQLLESYALGDPVTDGDAAKLAALYRGYMDEAAVEALGDAPLKPLIERVRSVQDKAALAALMGEANGGFGNTFVRAMVSDDQRDPDRHALYLSQSGLGLGDRALYLDDKFAPQRERYVAYVEQLLELAGWDAPAEAAKAVLALETRIAEAHWTRADSRDRDKTYNPVAIADLQQQAPGFPWAAYFKAAGLAQAERAVLRQNTAFPALARIFDETALDTLKAWQAFHVTDQAAPLLSRAFVEANFEFRSKFMSGQPEPRPRWKRAVAFTEMAMGEAIGSDYEKLYFKPEAKAKMDELVANVKAAMGARLSQLAWMGEDTRKEAAAKLERFGLKIGYPEQWEDYSALDVRNGDLFGNAQRAYAFMWDDMRTRLGKPVDDAEWGMTPQTVNAYYSPVKNEIVFPAAILQPPFFDPDADMAVNYGAIGGVIGHEIIHGFDDQGRKSDGHGMLREWWTPEDAAKFEAEAAKLGAQYESYTFPQLPGMHINGTVSMGENIGDLGGLTIALEAWRRSLDGQPAPEIDGFTGEQRFFMGWAQVWRILWRDDALRQQLVNGPHSPGQIRAFAPLRNIDAWYEAFNVTEADPLWIAPEDRVRIW